MNITPLITTSQPNQPSPAPAGTTEGSDSLFGKIFGQTIAADRQQGEKIQPSHNAASQKKQPTTEQDQPSVFPEVVAAASDNKRETLPEAVGNPQPEISAPLQKTVFDIQLPEIADTKTNLAVLGTDGKELLYPNDTQNNDVATEQPVKSVHHAISILYSTPTATGILNTSGSDRILADRPNNTTPAEPIIDQKTATTHYSTTSTSQANTTPETTPSLDMKMTSKSDMVDQNDSSRIPTSFASHQKVEKTETISSAVIQKNLTQGTTPSLDTTMASKGDLVDKNDSSRIPLSFASHQNVDKPKTISPSVIQDNSNPGSTRSHDTTMTSLSAPGDTSDNSTNPVKPDLFANHTEQITPATHSFSSAPSSNRTQQASVLTTAIGDKVSAEPLSLQTDIPEKIAITLTNQNEIRKKQPDQSETFLAPKSKILVSVANLNEPPLVTQDPVKNTLTLSSYVTGTDSDVIPSGPAQNLWPASVPLSNIETVTLTGYFTAQKFQSPSSSQIDAAVIDNHLTPATDQSEKLLQKPHLPIGSGLAHLAAIAEKYPLAMSSTVKAADITLTQGTVETAPLMVSLNQLTSLKPSGTESQDKYRPLSVEPLRQQFQDQLIQLKTETQKNDAGEQQSSPKQGTAVLVQGAPTSVTSSIEHPLSFSEFGQNMMSPAPANNHIANSQPVAPLQQPSPVAHDNAVLQQVAERFYLQMQNQETRLKIQLQPAELGKLDINLTVKEGAIRAHVITQSGQVQELLERNMSRLKHILESQGFSVEDIRLSAANESVDKSDLFQEQLAQHHQHAEQNSQNSDTPFDESLHRIITSGTEKASGVNITA